MRTVYAVSRGSYSDYSVVALFNHKPDAEAFAVEYTAKGAHWDAAFVEEFSLCRRGEVPRFKTVYAVALSDDGTEQRRWSFRGWKTLADTSDQAARVGLSNRSYEHATKIARDSLARWKAEKAGVADA